MSGPPNLYQSLSGISKPISNLTTLSDPAASRLSSAGLSKGAYLPDAEEVDPANIDYEQSPDNGDGGGDSGDDTEGDNSSPNPNIAAMQSTQVAAFAGPQGKDWRVKVTCKEISNFSGLLEPLKNTGGVIFPHTPTITVGYQANYAAQKYTHSNYPMYTYENSEVQPIQISGEFTAQNSAEAAYVLACIYFFRASTKMFFGASKNAGAPPPIVRLSGYGDQYFPSGGVPCVVTSFTHTMPPDVDYINTGQTRIPAISTITVNLQPLYSKSTLTKFDLNKFSTGGQLGIGLI
jgi:hypothetical protein